MAARDNQGSSMTRAQWTQDGYVWSGWEYPRPDTHDASMEYLRRCREGSRGYDLRSVIHQLEGLASRRPKHAAALERMRDEIASWRTEDE